MSARSSRRGGRQIYRLWLVWAYDVLVTIFPLSTLIGLVGTCDLSPAWKRNGDDVPVAHAGRTCAVCAIGSIYASALSKPGEDIFATATGRWITANCVFTLWYVPNPANIPPRRQCLTRVRRGAASTNVYSTGEACVRCSMEPAMAE